MRSSHPSHRIISKPSLVMLGFTIMTIIGLASLLSGCSKKTPSPAPTSSLPSATPRLAAATPTPLPPDLPPDLVETDPIPGAQLTLENPITFYFNQPMDRPTVEEAISAEPSINGTFTWQDDSKLTFTPDAPFLPATSLTITIDTGAQSTKGMSLLQPIQLTYSTIGYLDLVQELPAVDASEVDPTSAIVAAFNQPVVPLGADPATLPAGFSLTPSADGSGEWINTSTYIFYAEPALAGGENYRVSINPDLTSTGGSPLESSPAWSFNTAMPRLVSSQPADFAYNVRLDTNIQLNFSYSMDSASVEANFSLQTMDGDQVTGQSAWNEDFTTYTFTPTNLLQRDATYRVSLGAEAAALGGTPLGAPIRLTWYTVPEFFISGSEPSEGGAKLNYEAVRLFVSSYLSEEDIDEYVTFNPPVPNLGSWIDPEQLAVSFYGDFDPETNYTFTVSPDLADLWGSRLGKTYTLHFRTDPLEPSVQFPYNPDTTFLTTQDTGLLAQVTNISAIPLSVGTMTLDDLSAMNAENGYDFRQSFTPSDAESWTFYPEVPSNQSTTVSIPISPDGQPRSPGLYFMRVNLPDMYRYTPNIIIAVSHYQTTLKLSQTDALVWAVDLDTQNPAANLPVTIYDQAGNKLVSGVTDVNGVFQAPIASYQDPYDASYTVLGELGEDNFGFAMSYWNEGVSPWNFDLPVSYYPPSVMAYIYTDRPIYRPGDTVYFRMVIRQASNGRYSLPEISSFPLVLFDTLRRQQVASFDLPLSGFGTAHGEYKIPTNAVPGNYWLHNPDEYIGVQFQVADYRKPEINLQVTFQDTDVLSGTALLAEVSARYFFDAPAGNMPVHWVLYRQNSYFNIPNYQVGPVDTSWLDVFNYNFGMGGLGSFVSEGDDQTDPNGLLKPGALR